MSAVVRMFYNVPVIGWLVKDAVHGTPEAKYFFAFNLVVLLIAGIYFIGYPLLITLGLIGSAAGLSGLVLLTCGDAFDSRASDAVARAPAPPVRKPSMRRAA
ncbi:conserved hypothetical protein [Rhodopseudomonas palustris HaA2]|uniref:Uncharacterized protein n=1 Tax=Rhodopseudomonas palustris (strain HaA2) TaxID=316058 RepID=Q2J0Z6_RHOP2|nr:hypothetical protein [Rhodopseudomonas palustris]ABD05864.1 conserved hypothetical protein [Rhodopseudomonas palustris HaA2]